MKTFALLFALAVSSDAALITSLSSIPGPSATIDFSQFAGAAGLVTKGPVQVGTLAGRNVVFTSTNPDGSVLGSSFYTLDDNGTFGSPLAFAGLDVDAVGNDRYTMNFKFNSGPVSAVGGLINYATFAGSGFGDAMIAALSSNGTVLESYDLNTAAPISTPGGVNAGAFRGIVRPTADISAFALSNSAVAIANLTFTTAVPEPASMFLIGSGLGIILLLRRR